MLLMYSDESGLLCPNRKQSHYFGLGGLVIPDFAISDTLATVRKLREKHNFFINFEYKNNNKHKIPFCINLLDWYFSERNLSFFAIVLRVQDLDWSYWKKGTQQPHIACYTWFYSYMMRMFYADYVKEGVQAKIIIDRQSTSQKELRNRFDYFRQDETIVGVEERDSYNDDLLQIVDLFISSTLNRFTLFEHPNHTKCRVKNGISEYLLQKLGVDYFWNWRRIGENWGPTGVTWMKDRNNPGWERPNIKGTKTWGRKFDLFSWHGK